SLDLNAQGGGTINDFNQDVVVSVGVSGTNLTYLWNWVIVDNDNPFGPSKRNGQFFGGRQIVIHETDNRYPVSGETGTYYVSITNPCGDGATSHAITFKNISPPPTSVVCLSPAIVSQPPSIDSPQPGTPIRLGVGAKTDRG